MIVNRRIAVGSQVRQGFLGRREVDRAVLFLRGTGCAWMKRSGGCTFCGFWSSHNLGERLTSTEYIAQVDTAIAEFGPRWTQCPIVCVYNGGSMLDEAEIDLQTVTAIFDRLSAAPHIESIVVEAKVSDICAGKLERLVAAMHGRRLSVAIGMESANELVRDLCVNKPFSDAQLHAASRMLARHEVGLIALLMVKPPFLSEMQAIADCVKTIRMLDALGVERIDLEVPVVKRHTVMHALWSAGLYSPPTLWSVIEILKQAEAAQVSTQLYWSPLNVPGQAEASAANCDGCTPRIAALVDAYNRFRTVRVFEDVSCVCRGQWAAEVACGDGEIRPSELIAHIEDILAMLEANDVSTATTLQDADRQGKERTYGHRSAAC